MGGKLGSKARTGSGDMGVFLAGVAAEHKPTFDTLRALILELVPESTETLKWGTLAYDLEGSLFALSAAKPHVNLYILTTGVIAAHQRELAGIPQSHCVLRFAPGRVLPMAALRTVMRAAIAIKKQ